MIKYSKGYYAKSQKKYRDTHKEYKKKWSMTGIKKQIRDRLGNKCSICGWVGLCHIHHKEKGYIRRHFKITEIAQYNLLCPNCHYTEHKVIGREKNVQYSKSSPKF